MPATLPHYEHFLVVGNNVTFNGIRLQGPDGRIGTSGSDPLIDGIYCSGKTGLVVENCEIYDWPYAGIAYYSDGLPGLGSSSKAHIRHNYIHHCRRLGLGYGVQVGASSALIEANIFDYCRHAIAGERGYPTSNYEARFNVVEPNITNSMFDMHGGNDTPSWGFADGPDRGVPAGGTILIHHNTFKSSSQIAVGIRGVPADVCRVYNNWTYWPSSKSSTAFKQRLENLRLIPYVKMKAYDNWYGTPPPPRASPNSPLATPSPPSGTNSGQVGTAYTYQAVTTDVDGNPIRYTFDWGDGTSSTTDLLNSGVTAAVSHTWTVAGDYWLHVQATNSRGAVSSMSYPGLQVTIVNSGQPETAPTLVSPSNAASVSGTSLTFEWGSVSGAVDYKLVVSTSYDIFKTASHVFNQQVGNVTTYTDTGYSATGKTYFWWVFAYDADGTYSTFSQVIANGQWFTCQPTIGAPTLISPVGGVSVSGSSVNFQWSAVPDAVDYQLVVSTSYDIFKTASHVFNQQVGNVTTYTVNLAGGKTYFWWVFAYDADGTYSVFSQVIANGQWSTSTM
jgi:hypothetical protein